MGKTLVIVEKPSVALDLSRALGRFEKRADFFENDRFVISSAIDHLVELCLPAEIDKRKGKWSFQNLPIDPEDLQLRPIAKTESRYQLLCRLYVGYGSQGSIFEPRRCKLSTTYPLSQAPVSVGVSTLLGCLYLGDDADTTGAIYGQIAGAFYGGEAIPAEWKATLAKRELIIHLADRLYDLANYNS